MDRNAGYYNMQGSYSGKRWIIEISTDFKDLCVLYTIAWVCLPILSGSLIFRILALGCSGLFFILISPKIHGTISTYTLCSALLLALLFGIIWLGQGDLSLALSRTTNVLIFAILGLFSLYYHQYERRKLKIFFYYIVVLFLIIAVPSLIALQSNQYVMRNASGLTVRTGIERFAGSYGYVYGCVILETIMVYDIRHNKHTTWMRLFQLGTVLLIGYLILNSGYTTAIILTLLGIIMALSVKKSGITTIILFGCIGIALLSVIPTVLKYIFDHFDIPDVYRQKLSILIEMTDSNSDMSYTDSTRGQLLIRGLEAILHYPIFGSVLLAGEHISGGHQALIDAMAQYGILYAVLYYYVIYYTAIRQLKGDSKLKLVVGLLLLALGLTNTYDYTTFAVPLLVGPYIANKTKHNSLKDGSV